MRAPRSFIVSAIWLTAVCALAASTSLRAQDSTAVRDRASTERVFDTRTELEERLELLERRLAGVESGSETRDSLQPELVRLERRLRRGDFQPGNIVEIRVPGYDSLSGRFPVGPERELALPRMGTLDLSGVLYAEADSVIGGWLRQYVRADRVRIRPLQRVAVLGEVRSPGFYDLSPATPLSEAVMAAGGPTSSSDLDELEVRRSGRTVLSADEHPLDESASLEELGVERGDQIFVPRESAGFGFSTVVGAIGALGTVSFAISRIF